MAICECSPSCEHYVSSRSQTGLHRNCAARIARWEKAEVHEAMEYARKLEVRRGTLGYVVTKTQVASQAIEKRKEVAAREEQERKDAEREATRKRRLKAKGRVDARKKGSTVRTHERQQGRQQSRQASA